MTDTKIARRAASLMSALDRFVVVLAVVFGFLITSIVIKVWFA